MLVVATNKRAHFDYEILDTVQAGVVLTGDEVKSIRNKAISLNDAFATVHNGEISLINCNISPYSHAYSKKDTSRRTRKLLLRRQEINKIIGTLAKKGLVLIPIKALFNDRGYLKIILGFGKHKKLYDKKQQLIDRDVKREAARAKKLRF